MFWSREKERSVGLVVVVAGLGSPTKLPARERMLNVWVSWF